jgi:hypothetical protein
LDTLARMPHRDDLGAAHDRIRELEERVRELEGGPVPPPEPPPGLEPPPGTRSRRGLLGIPFGVAFIAAGVVFGPAACGRGCAAMSPEETEPAMAALRKCPAAQELLGDGIDWAWVGCANYESESGGDPTSGGCHGNASWQMPVRGSKARGSYEFSSSQLPGKDWAFTGGRLLAGGAIVTIAQNGECSRLGL